MAGTACLHHRRVAGHVCLCFEHRAIFAVYKPTGGIVGHLGVGKEVMSFACRRAFSLQGMNTESACSRSANGPGLQERRPLSVLEEENHEACNSLHYSNRRKHHGNEMHYSSVAGLGHSG